MNAGGAGIARASAWRVECGAENLAQELSYRNCYTGAVRQE